MYIIPTNVMAVSTLAAFQHHWRLIFHVQSLPQTISAAAPAYAVFAFHKYQSLVLQALASSKQLLVLQVAVCVAVAATMTCAGRHLKKL